MEGVLRFTIDVDCSTPFLSKNTFFYKKMPRRRHTAWTPDKNSQTAALCRVFSIVQRKDRPSRGTALQGFPHGVAPAGCRGGRNKMLSPRRGIPWARYEHGTDSRYLQPDNLFFLYIPQFLPRGLRHLFIRHISINSQIRLQKDTLFLLQAHLAFCRCAFFAP